MDERTFHQLLRRAIAIPVALLVLLAIVLVVEILTLTESLHLVDHTDQVISQRSPGHALHGRHGVQCPRL